MVVINLEISFEVNFEAIVLKLSLQVKFSVQKVAFLQVYCYFIFDYALGNQQNFIKLQLDYQILFTETCYIVLEHFLWLFVRVLDVPDF